MWIIYALLSAFFAGCTAILIKIGVTGISSNLATALRTLIVLLMSWLIVILSKQQLNLAILNKKNIIFLGLSGVATCLSWLTYNKALQIGPASKVIPIDNLSIVIGMLLAFIILHETADLKTILGGVIVTIGVIIIVL